MTMYQSERVNVDQAAQNLLEEDEATHTLVLPAELADTPDEAEGVWETDILGRFENAGHRIDDWIVLLVSALRYIRHAFPADVPAAER